MKKRAFTLIELLVVVAIIAVLASIAVVNFLEAQVRAKVSRAKTDIKAVVTGVEAYAVDNNNYPTFHYADVPMAHRHFYMGGKVTGFGQPDPDFNGAAPITTPIAYLSTMPKDPFLVHEKADPAETAQFLYVNWPYAVKQMPTHSLAPVFRYAGALYGPYRLHSPGPALAGPDSGTPYDPTNGTVSTGDITWGTNTGFGKYIPFPTNESLSN